MANNRFQHLQQLQGEPFWIELCAEGLQILTAAARLETADLAALLRRSESLASQLLSGQARCSDNAEAIITRQFGIRPLHTPEPNAMPLVELTARSLLIVRKGRRFSRKALSEATAGEVSARYIQYIEEDERHDFGRNARQALSQALNVQFFVF